LRTSELWGPSSSKLDRLLVMPKTRLRTVPDTNILLASEISGHPSSPNKEFFTRWKADEFRVLFSRDTLYEYIKKLREKQVSEVSIKRFLVALLHLGTEVEIEFYHLPVYPQDADDIAFLLCADNGEATHIVTYDRHLLRIADRYPFRICRPVGFLDDLRRELEN